MKVFSRKLDRKVGFAPGDTNYFGEEVRSETFVKCINYNLSEINEIAPKSVDEILEISDDKNTWIDIEGFANLELIKQIGMKYDIHEMTIEDVLNVNHLPKYEEGEEYILFVLKNFREGANKANGNHVSILLKKNLVISFREAKSNLLPPKIERIKAGKGRARRKGADYLFFVLLDAFIDSYYYYFEYLREQIGELDDKILRETNENHIQEIYDLKNELTSIRKNLFPLKTSINELITDDNDLIEEDNFKYFNDCKDHVNELIEYYHSFNEMINNLITLNESNLNNQTNRIMKVLTIIATIFIPLTFIAGLYGMNFEYMPELKWKYGYFIALGTMILLGIIILIFMKKKKWI